MTIILTVVDLQFCWCIIIIIVNHACANIIYHEISADQGLVELQGKLLLIDLTLSLTATFKYSNRNYSTMAINNYFLSNINKDTSLKKIYY